MSAKRRSAGQVMALLLLSLLASCVTPQSTMSIPVIDQVEPVSNAAPAPEPEPVACVPEINMVEQMALRKLRLANEWHSQGRYDSAFEAYESALAENASPLSDAYALFGLVAMRLDRDAPSYDREIAQMTMHVLEQRASLALQTGTPDNDSAANEARLLLYSARAMVAADIDKDNVIIENRKLREEVATLEEAIARLRELTLGR